MTEDKIAILIKKTALVIEKLFNQALTPYGLTHTQYKILMLLYRNADRPIRQIDIETKFSMTNPTVTGIIQNLEKNGWVKRIANPNDKRSKLILPTEHALSLKNELHKVGETLDEQVTGILTKEEYDQLTLLLKKVFENI